MIEVIFIIGLIVALIILFGFGVTFCFWGASILMPPFVMLLLAIGVLNGLLVAIRNALKAIKNSGK